MADLEFSYEFQGRLYRCTAERVGPSWANALQVCRYGANGECVDQTTWACHPEFPDFEELQALSAEGLCRLVRQSMNTEVFDRQMQIAHEAGLRRLNFRISLHLDNFIADVQRNS